MPLPLPLPPPTTPIRELPTLSSGDWVPPEPRVLYAVCARGEVSNVWGAPMVMLPLVTELVMAAEMPPPPPLLPACRLPGWGKVLQDTMPAAPTPRLLLVCSEPLDWPFSRGMVQVVVDP